MTQAQGKLIVGHDTDIYYFTGTEIRKIDALGNDTQLYSGIADGIDKNAFGISDDGTTLVLVQDNNISGSNITTYSTVSNIITNYSPVDVNSQLITFAGGNIVFVSNTDFYLAASSNILRRLNITLDSNTNTYSVIAQGNNLGNFTPAGVAFFNSQYYFMGIQFIPQHTYIFDQNGMQAALILAGVNNAPYQDIIFVDLTTSNGLTGQFFYLLSLNSPIVNRYTTSFVFVDSFTLMGAGSPVKSLSYSITPPDSFERFYIAGDNLRKLYFTVGGSAVAILT